MNIPAFTILFAHKDADGDALVVKQNDSIDADSILVQVKHDYEAFSHTVALPVDKIDDLINALKAAKAARS